MPTSNGGTNGSNGATGANGQSSSQSGTGSGPPASRPPSPSTGWSPTSTARIAADVTVTATTGAVTVRSDALGQRERLRDGLGDRHRVRAARAWASPSASTCRTSRTGRRVGADADGERPRRHLGRATDALVSDVPQRNEYIVWAFAAGGGKSTSFAGSAAVQILLLTTEALRRAAAPSLDAPAGGITVGAGQSFGLQNLAIAGCAVDQQRRGHRRRRSRSTTSRSPPRRRSTPATGSRLRHDGAMPRARLACTATRQLVPLVPEVPEPLDGKIDWLTLTSVAIAGGASSGRRGRHRRLHHRDLQPRHAGVDRRRRAGEPGGPRRRRRPVGHRARRGQHLRRRRRRHTVAQPELGERRHHRHRRRRQLQRAGMDRRFRRCPRGRIGHGRGPSRRRTGSSSRSRAA